MKPPAVTEPSDLENLFGTIRRYALLILLSAALAAAAAFALSNLQETRYQASAKLLYEPDRFSAGGSLDSDRRLSTLVILATSDQVLREAATKLGPPWSVERLERALEVRPPGSSEVIVLRATAPTAEDAARVANVTSQSFVSWRLGQQRDHVRVRMSSLRSQLDRLAGRTAPSDVAAAADLRTQLAQASAELESPTTDVTLVEPARRPQSAISPKPVRNGIVGFVAGLVLGFLFAGILSRLDRRVRYVEDVEEIHEAAILGAVPHVKQAARGDRAAALADFSQLSPLAEAFRTIRTNLDLMNVSGPGRSVLVVSSAGPSEGKSGVVANLGAAYASAGRRVLMIGADLRSPSLHEYFRLPPDDAESLLVALSGARPLTAVAEGLDQVAGKGSGSLSILGSRRRHTDPADLLQSNALVKLLADARKSYDVVLVDSPPLLVGPEASALAQQADGLLLVTNVGRLRREEALRAAKTLRALSIVPVGLVVTGRPESHVGGYGYGYGYGHTGGRVRGSGSSRETVHAGSGS
jgi:capsular exopolysaccharide synthesis family protein